MLDSFACIGATRFDVTWTNSAGQPKRFREGVRLADLTRAIPAILIEATAKERNVIVRPHGPGVTFIQLDDLTADKLPTMPPPCFSPSKPRRRWCEPRGGIQSAALGWADYRIDVQHAASRRQA
jgi:hypothetical protein